MELIYKIAETTEEFKEIHELNYRTFVEEIPQHERHESRILKDKFHDENTYIICLKNKRVIGMIAVRSNRPFSLDGKIGLVEKQLPIKAKKLVEIRLLAIEKKYRNGRAFLGLAQALIRYCIKEGYDAALISGTMREQKLYGQLGFTPFATLTGATDAPFQPMYLTKETFDAGIAGRISKPAINFLPGPATISEEVKRTMSTDPYSHRSAEYEALIARVKHRLTTLTNSNHVQVLHGTGTLANDVVAAQLSAHKSRGLILVNGEFGERLTDHARCFGLEFDTLEIEWGKAFEEWEITKAIQQDHYNWIWAVHSETSTGVLNDLDMLKNSCNKHDLHLAIDCVSALGSIPINLEGVMLASGVSGKGLSSYTGLAFVFHHNKVHKNPLLPRYLDLGAYDDAKSIPYTQSSNLMSALDSALKKYERAEEVYNAVAERMRIVKSGIEEIGLLPLVMDQVATSPIVTITMPSHLSSRTFGDNLYINGFNVHYESSYLINRNWLQISGMNDVTNNEVRNMLEVLSALKITSI